jgi:cytidine deaminase
MKTLAHTFHYLYCTYDELPEQDRQLIDAAMQATGGSYAPYSKFFVGVALQLIDGTIVTGANQENVAYPSGMCAERTALFYAGAAYPDKAVVALAIAARTSEEGFTVEPITPCGACRQVMLEAELRYHTPMRILLYGTRGIYVVEGGARELLPLQFDSF